MVLIKTFTPIVSGLSPACMDAQFRQHIAAEMGYRPAPDRHAHFFLELTRCAVAPEERQRRIDRRPIRRSGFARWLPLIKLVT